MSDTVSYSIQASAAPVTAMVRVRIMCRQPSTTHRWNLELPRVLWTSMGTHEAAVFVTERYFDAYPAERAFNVQDHIAEAVATSLRDASAYFTD
ncbi:hypothetical protein [Hymenobacter sp. CRA2]|uniref:hypothetical protein n=1 Tax=Hymenobacter sp. CRA2 TaxID=1955620 RepID=UPI0009901554|nr:hypothetical protein [Hymenobacter sp. CRA2]OON66457.1 hypothetical protein B0919_21725 [Hymenobacter sp. CRA2]